MSMTSTAVGRTAGESYRSATFKAATKNIHQYRVAKACNAMRPGVDFRGMNKTEIRKEFVRGWLSQFTGNDLRAALAAAKPTGAA